MNPFDKYSLAYSNSSKSQINAGVQLIDILNPQNHMNILDVGCGDGRITKILASKCSGVIGIDPSAILLDIAKSKNCTENLRYIQTSVEDLNFFQEFDAVYSNSAFGWFEQSMLDRSMHNIYRALKFDGIFALQTSYKQYWCPQFYKCVSSICSNDRFAKIYHSFNWKINHFDNVSTYAKFIEKSGLEITLVLTEVTSQTYTVEDAYKQFTTSIMNAYCNQKYYELEINQDYITQLHYCLLEGLQSLSVNGNIELNYNRLYILSKKNGKLQKFS